MNVSEDNKAIAVDPADTSLVRNEIKTRDLELTVVVKHSSDIKKTTANTKIVLWKMNIRQISMADNSRAYGNWPKSENVAFDFEVCTDFSRVMLKNETENYAAFESR